MKSGFGYTLSYVDDGKVRVKLKVVEARPVKTFMCYSFYVCIPNFVVKS